MLIVALAACQDPAAAPPIAEADDTPLVCALGEPCDLLAPPPADPTCGALLREALIEEESPAWPERLSDLGCFSADLTPAPGVYPYHVQAPLFSEGADKGRWLSLPPGGVITPTVDDGWSFPTGTLLIKAFVLPLAAGPAPIEVRLMLRTDPEWRFATYAWDGAGDHDLVPTAGASAPQALDDGTTLTWTWPSELSCWTCHQTAGDEVIGLRTRQLHHPVDYGGRRAEQLAALDGAGLFTPRLADLGPLPRMPDPYVDSGDTSERARAWLHANCAHCHQPGGFVPPDQPLDLRFATPFAGTAACGVPTRGSSQIAGEVLIDPGQPSSSHLYNRLITTSVEKMPPDGAARIDRQGVDLVEAWIRHLTGCP